MKFNNNGSIFAMMIGFAISIVAAPMIEAYINLDHAYFDLCISVSYFVILGLFLKFFCE